MLDKIIINPNYSHIYDEIKDIESFFHESNESIHKARNELKIIEIKGEKYVVKSFKKPHLLNRFIYTFFRKTKAQKSYENGLALQKLAVNTPDPVAYLHFKTGGMLDKSYFISKYLPYDFSVREIFRHEVENYEELLQYFSEFTYSLHQKGIWHKDYTSGNILVTQEQENYSFWLVDINRMQFKHIEPTYGLSAFSKFFSTEEDLEKMVQVYAQKASLEFEKAYKIAHMFYTKLKNKKKLKAKIKSKN